MKSTNPILKEDAFKETAVVLSPDQAMSVQGTINKSLILGVILLLTGAVAWNECAKALVSGNAGLTQIYMYGGAIGGFILGLVTVFKKEWSPVTTLFYAAFEGAFLGAISMFFNAQFPGIAMQAALCTISTLFCLLFLYRTGLIKATEQFKTIIFTATAGIAVVYLISMGLGFFGIKIPLIHESGIVGIGFSIFVTAIAALNLVLDFDFIENASLSGRFPKYMEWYGAFGLMVTLVWLYVEFLRLLSKLRRR